MNRSLRIVAGALAFGGLAFFASCNSSIDDGDGPAVQLEVSALENEAVTSTAAGAGCTREVTEWSVTLQNVPKNALANASPFNDVVMGTVDIAYNWQTPGIATPNRTYGLGGVTVPANGSSSVDFFPVSVEDLAGVPVVGGTASLTMIFRGQMVDGTNLSVGAQAELFVEACPP